MKKPERKFEIITTEERYKDLMEVIFFMDYIDEHFKRGKIIITITEKQINFDCTNQKSKCRER